MAGVAVDNQAAEGFIIDDGYVEVKPCDIEGKMIPEGNFSRPIIEQPSGNSFKKRW